MGFEQEIRGWFDEINNVLAHPYVCSVGLGVASLVCMVHSCNNLAGPPLCQKQSGPVTRVVQHVRRSYVI